jgi:hypothetical protein
MPTEHTTGPDVVAMLMEETPAGDMTRRLLAHWPAAVAAWRGTKRRLLEVWAETAGEQLAAVLARGMPLVRTGLAKGDGTIEATAAGYLVRWGLGVTGGDPDAALNARIGQQRAEIAALRARLAAYERALQARISGEGPVQ